MSDLSAPSAVTQLEELLDAERRALLAGDLEQLGDLLPRKQALLIGINGLEDLDLHILRSLDRDVQRNQVLLDGALEGIRAVARRLATLRKLRSVLETYGADGRKSTIDVQTTGKIEKRA